MYIITSASINYRGPIIGYDHVIRAGTIGHEIHITRPVLMVLLSNKLITTDDIIVTKNYERFFLYNKIFKNIIQYDDLPLNVSGNEMIDLTHLNSLWEHQENKDYILDVEKRFPILLDIRWNKIVVRTPEYNNLISLISYDYFEPKNEFVVIHQRITDYGPYDKDLTTSLIKSILETFPFLDIYVFSVKDIEFKHEKVFHTKYIDTYTSLMSHEKCRGVITPWSGGGQLAQICHTRNIFYYYSCYVLYEEQQDLNSLFKIANNDNNMYRYSDLKIITKTNIFVNASGQQIINLMKQYLDSDGEMIYSRFN